jgi:hypothetical protein
MGLFADLLKAQLETGDDQHVSDAGLKMWGMELETPAVKNVG